MAKYKNSPQTVDGIRFDSKKEAKRYAELKLLEKAKEITGLRIHQRWPLKVNGVKICEYESDFDYQEFSEGFGIGPDYWKLVVEDVKSPITRKLPLYRLKKKLMEAVHGIEIREV